jgi:hypothetical protein
MLCTDSLSARPSRSVYTTRQRTRSCGSTQSLAMLTTCGARHRRPQHTTWESAYKIHKHNHKQSNENAYTARELLRGRTRTFRLTTLVGSSRVFDSVPIMSSSSSLSSAGRCRDIVASAARTDAQQPVSGDHTTSRRKATTTSAGEKVQSSAVCCVMCRDDGCVALWVEVRPYRRALPRCASSALQRPSCWPLQGRFAQTC